MDPIIKYERIMHHAMSCVAGFLGAYGLLLRDATFGSSMTSNLIYIFITGFTLNFKEAIYRIIAVIIYLAGLGLTTMIKPKSRFTWPKISILINTAAAIVLGFIPMEANYVVALYPIFFATAIQWNSFPKMGPYTSASIFSTNNIRQFTQSGLLYLRDRDAGMLDKFKAFGFTLLWYHVGAIYCIIATLNFGYQGAWLCIIPSLITLVMELRFEKSLRV